ncbi:MAG: beta-phosphoglucomutase [Anaerolineae bacterium]
MTASIRALIFDLDGVLTNTPMLHYDSWKRLAADENIPFTWDQHERMQGKVRHDSLAVFLNGRPVSDEQAKALMARKNEYFLELLENVTPADSFPGVLELLTEAKKKGFRIGLGSSSMNARNVISKLGLAPFFEVLGDGHSVSRHKPAPDIFLWTAQQLGVEPRQAVVFEDSEAGMQAAINGGFWRVGLGGKHGKGAHLEYETMAEIQLDDLLAKLATFGNFA